MNYILRVSEVQFFSFFHKCHLSINEIMSNTRYKIYKEILTPHLHGLGQLSSSELQSLFFALETFLTSEDFCCTSCLLSIPFSFPSSTCFFSSLLAFVSLSEETVSVSPFSSSSDLSFSCFTSSSLE